MPLHGKTGMVKISGRGKPRNHLVTVDEVDYVIPCGNINCGEMPNKGE